MTLVGLVRAERRGMQYGVCLADSQITSDTASAQHNGRKIFSVDDEVVLATGRVATFEQMIHKKPKGIAGAARVLIDSADGIDKRDPQFPVFLVGRMFRDKLTILEVYPRDRRVDLRGGSVRGRLFTNGVAWVEPYAVNLHGCGWPLGEEYLKKLNLRHKRTSFSIAEAFLVAYGAGLAGAQHTWVDETFQFGLYGPDGLVCLFPPSVIHKYPEEFKAYGELWLQKPLRTLSPSEKLQFGGALSAAHDSLVGALEDARPLWESRMKGKSLRGAHARAYDERMARVEECAEAFVARDLDRILAVGEERIRHARKSL